MEPVDLFKKRHIVVLGARAVGKSALVVRYIKGKFDQEYYPTIELLYRKTIEHKQSEYHCEIVDTAGQDEFSFLNPTHAIGTHGYILVYSVTSRRSYDMISIIYDKIIEFSGLQNVPLVIVGQKSDLGREVTVAEAKTLAQTLDGAYVETSALDGSNVDNVFQLCLSEIENKNKQRKAKPSTKRDGWCVVM